MIALPYTHPTMFEVYSLFVFRYADPFLRRIGRSGNVSPSIHVGGLSIAFENDRLYRKNAFSSTQSLGGAGDHAHGCLRLLLSGGVDDRRCNCGYEQRRCEQECFFHNPICPGGIANQPIELVLFGWNAAELLVPGFSNCTAFSLTTLRSLCPELRIVLRIRNNHGEFQRIGIRSAIASLVRMRRAVSGSRPSTGRLPL